MPDDVPKKVVSRVIERLAAERARQNLSQQSLADRAGLSRTGIRHFESGEVQPTLLTFLLVAEALGVDLAKAIREAGKPTPLKKKRPGQQPK